MEKIIYQFTNKQSDIGYISESNSIHVYDERNPNDLLDNLAMPIHLYLVSDDNINVDDWYYTKARTEKYSILKCDSERLACICNMFGAKKIIRTTNNNLAIELLTELEVSEFIKNFNKQ